MSTAGAHVILTLIWVLYPADTKNGHAHLPQQRMLHQTVCEGVIRLQDLAHHVILTGVDIVWRQQLLVERNPTPKGATGISALPLLIQKKIAGLQAKPDMLPTLLGEAVSSPCRGHKQDTTRQCVWAKFHLQDSDDTVQKHLVVPAR